MRHDLPPSLVSSRRRGPALRISCAASAVLAGAVALAPMAQALDLDGARNQGLVCEAPDGLVRALAPSPEVKALVADTNARRMQAYQASAQTQNVPVNQVQAVSGGLLRQKHPACP
ncbi:DUF1318 domain-containing protein [Pararhodospirillum oryzae]|uniref:DUF1318 domain-containing protein n=1 Tax=Pararhodospirillum oryzae TaxID=478448 RepID=A0A512H3H2_9PROT|nr:DUF1318 domain-containing protein [Pararhodospirillum oryzae]GEO80004.1 hypothetical protein ROR02_01350 [Pararhodospirillum oryzae]